MAHAVARNDGIFCFSTVCQKAAFASFQTENVSAAFFMPTDNMFSPCIACAGFATLSP
jgi:hypothetical protein